MLLEASWSTGEAQLVRRSNSTVIDTKFCVSDRSWSQHEANQGMLYINLSRMTRQHVTVALSGDGGDESFLGYKRYPYSALGDRLGSILTPAGRRLVAAAANISRRICFSCSLGSDGNVEGGGGGGGTFFAAGAWTDR